MTKTKKQPTQEDRLSDIGRNAYACIVDMVAKLDAETEDGDADDDAREAAREAINEDPLSVQVRSGWHELGEAGEAEEYEILLSTGGPATRIIGELRSGEPHSARLEAQDWGTQWTEYITPVGEPNTQETLLAYARCFYFGEG